jgi:hypothetical protein
VAISIFIQTKPANTVLLKMLLILRIKYPQKILRSIKALSSIIISHKARTKGDREALSGPIIQTIAKNIKKNTP